MFMNQVSVYESDEITAFGLFKINLNLAMSVSEYYLRDWLKNISKSSIYKPIDMNT